MNILIKARKRGCGNCCADLREVGEKRGIKEVEQSLCGSVRTACLGKGVVAFLGDKFATGERVETLSALRPWPRGAHGSRPILSVRGFARYPGREPAVIAREYRSSKFLCGLVA